MRRLRDNGARFVRIPANYYDDLRDRLDLAEDLVRRMQALDIVYDRTPAGEYWHAYGEPFADRFFFEIVQRGAGYDGYGAVNAPARMASQEQRSAAASPAS
jgi:4-hydroxyphenylpyruvate dioxygenase